MEQAACIDGCSVLGAMLRILLPMAAPGIVTTLIPKEEFYSARSEQIVEDSYQGSLPAFVASFISRKKLTSEEAEEIQKMIDAFKKG